jgi:hypothetical protein
MIDNKIIKIYIKYNMFYLLCSKKYFDTIYNPLVCCKHFKRSGFNITKLDKDHYLKPRRQVLEELKNEH